MSLRLVRTMTMAEWRALHSDYKLVKPDGTRWALMNTEAGTALCRVEVIG